MIGPSRSPPPVLATEGPREDTPPTVATDVSASSSTSKSEFQALMIKDPRQPKSQLSTPSPRLGTPEKEPACIPFPQLTGHPCRNNEVRSVMLYGIPIVSLVIDQQERLCLAQISNTLLKDFSYNEIHNRRVALGITCVQCTPVQLELLRRAGAMPVSSRRCGMITKREAERLCKSFLVDTCPPKLPDNFAFDVYHQCAWGCRGSFVPSRYNSSRAKCIKCAYCGLFFSPNKFIFHSHRLPDSKYVQPDAANFNSWRRHIRLSGTPPEEVAFAWEDVKAMFNGGSRKRVMASSISSFSRNHHELKRSRLSSSSSIDLPTSSATSSSAPKQSLFPLVPLPNKTFSLPSSPPLIPPPAPFSLTGKPVSPTDIRQNFAEYMWAGKHPFPVPYGAVLWPRPPGMTPPVVDAEARSPESNSSGQSSSYRALEAVHRPLSSSSDGGASCSILTEREEEVGEVIHPSAFRPVGRSLNRLQMERPADSNPDTTTSGDVERFDNEEGPEGSESDQDEVDVTDISNDSSSDKLRRSINVDLQEKRDDSPIVDAIQSKKFSGHRQTETASPTSTEGERFASSSSFDVPKLSGLSKEELHEVLLQESQARRKAEVEYQLMRETFEVQVRKEIAYREEIAKQLQLVREAHDTLQHFSCKLLNTRHCSDCTLKPMLPE